MFLEMITWYFLAQLFADALYRCTSTSSDATRITLTICALPSKDLLPSVFRLSGSNGLSWFWWYLGNVEILDCLLKPPCETMQLLILDLGWLLASFKISFLCTTSDLTLFSVPGMPCPGVSRRSVSVIVGRLIHKLFDIHSVIEKLKLIRIGLLNKLWILRLGEVSELA